MVGLTLDTGALIALEALERGKTGNQTALRLAKMLANRADVRAHTPSVAVGEWWRGQRGKVAQLLTRFRIEIESVELEDAQSAGLILAQVDASDERRRGMLVDALVLVTAVTHGDVVYTSDIDDLSALRDAAGLNVKLFRV